MQMLTVATPPCIICGKEGSIDLPKDKYMEWIEGALVQDVFPDMHPAKREQLISGTCTGKCQAELFGANDDQG